MDKIENKLSSEWDAILSVYSKDDYTIVGIERPDFSVTRIEDQYSIGVEITQFYFHHASARLKNNPNYIQEVLSGVIHKKDKKVLSLDSIEILNSNDINNNPIGLEGVVYSHLSIREFQSLLTQTILKKNEKYKSLNSSFKKIELIITDEENYFSGWTEMDFSSAFYNNEYLNSIIQLSTFSEIYFIGNFFGEKKVFPLKKTLFGQRLFLIYSFFNYEPQEKRLSHSDFVLVLLAMFKGFGYFNIKGFKEAENCASLICENYQIKVNELDIGFRVVNYNTDFDELPLLNLNHEHLLKYHYYFKDVSNFIENNFMNITKYLLDPSPSTAII